MHTPNLLPAYRALLPEEVTTDRTASAQPKIDRTHREHKEDGNTATEGISIPDTLNYSGEG